LAERQGCRFQRLDFEVHPRAFYNAGPIGRFNLANAGNP
jgi:hypothetical protein